MDKLFLIVLSLSVSGSLLALVLFALRPLVRNRLSQSWQYYIWLVVLLRFILPFTPQASLVGDAAQSLERLAFVSQTRAEMERQGWTFSEEGQPESSAQTGAAGTPPAPQPKTQSAPPSLLASHSFWDTALMLLGFLWAAFALALFLIHIVRYRNYVRTVERNAQEIRIPHVALLYQEELAAAGIVRKPLLRVNEMLSTPMLVGIFRPCLLLPSAEVGANALRYIIRHELTHWKRRDSLYKWLVLAVRCIHWFNPLVYLIEKQVSKSCELACDEAVIRTLDDTERAGYGDTLLASLKSGAGKTPFTASMEMGGNAKIMKERLDAVMSFRKKSRFTVCAAAVLTVILLGGSALTGAYAAEPIGAGVSLNESNAVSQVSQPPVIVSVGKLPPGKAVCVGKITLDGTAPLQYDVKAEAGDSLFVALAKSDSLTSAAQEAWWNKVVMEDGLKVEGSVKTTLAKGTFYVYVGNEGSGEAKNISGSVYLEEGDTFASEFKAFAPYGVEYRAAENQLYYNGMRVKLFVCYSEHRAFRIFWADKNTDSQLYLQGQVDVKGKATGVTIMDENDAKALLEDLDDDKEQEKPAWDSKPLAGYNGKLYYTYDGSSSIALHNVYDIYATDKGLTKTSVPADVQKWIAGCDREKGAYLLQKSGSEGYTYYVYYNGGGRYPWGIGADGDTIYVNLFPSIPKGGDVGYELIQIESETEMDFSVSRDGTLLNLHRREA